MRRPTIGHKGRYHFSETAQLERDEMLMAALGGVQGEKAPIARIGMALAQIVKANTDIVQIGPMTVSKLRSKHTMVLDYDLGLLYHGFQTGRVQQHGPRHLIFLFRDPRKPERSLKAVVKASRDGSELLIATYHVCTGKQLTTALRRGEVVRDDGSWEKASGRPRQ